MILSKDIKAYRKINQINTTNSAVSYVYSQKSKSLFINLRNNNHQHQRSTNGRNREQKNEHRNEFRSRSKLSSSPHFGLMLSMYGQKGRNRMMEAVDRSDENYYLWLIPRFYDGILLTHTHCKRGKAHGEAVWSPFHNTIYSKFSNRFFYDSLLQKYQSMWVIFIFHRVLRLLLCVIETRYPPTPSLASVLV